MSIVEMRQTRSDHQRADRDPSDQESNRCQNCETGRERESESRDGAHEDTREWTARSAWCGKHRRKAPPDMLTSRSVQACLSGDVPTDHEAHGQSSSGCRESRGADLCSAQESRWLSFGARRPRGRSRTREARSYPRLGPQPERTWARQRRARRLVSPANHAQHVSEHAAHKQTVRQ